MKTIIVSTAALVLFASLKQMPIMSEATFREMELMSLRIKEQALTVALTITTISRETTIQTVARPHLGTQTPIWTDIMTEVVHRVGSVILMSFVLTVAS